MTTFYDGLDLPTKGAWVVHHGQKTASTVNAAAEFSALDAAGKAATLLSQFAASEQSLVDSSRVIALARAAGLNPKTELPQLIDMLERRRLIDRSSQGDIAVLGVTSRATVQYASEIFEDQSPTPEERAAIALAELSSVAPTSEYRTAEFLSDEFKLTNQQTKDFLERAETVGFVDSEGRDADKLFFNGNIFRREGIAKTNRVLGSLSSAEQTRTAALNSELSSHGCISIERAEEILQKPLFEKLRAAGVYDINHVANSNGEFGFITRPSAFHKFNDPLADDAFDLAKALVAALSYGMTQSPSGRGKIGMLRQLLSKLNAGLEIGPATAIGEDYRVLEMKNVIRCRPGPKYGHFMRLVKIDIGEMALEVLTEGEAASVSALDRPLPGSMTGYSGPEVTRSSFRQKKQTAESRRMTQDVLQALRTRGTL